MIPSTSGRSSGDGRRTVRGQLTKETNAPNSTARRHSGHSAHAVTGYSLLHGLRPVAPAGARTCESTQ